MLRFVLLFVMPAMLGLAILFVFLRPDGQPSASVDEPKVSDRSSSQLTADPDRAMIAPRVIDLSVLQTQPLSVQSYSAKQGQVVIINVQSERQDELHLHGYDLTLDIEPGQLATLEFLAEHAGRFELELHDSHQSLGVIEIQPQK